MSSSFSFWGANWTWAGLSPSFQQLGPGNFDFHAKLPSLGVSFDEHTAVGADGEQVRDFHFDDGAGMGPAIGGGMIFKFDLPHWQSVMGEPVLLPQNQGWRWGRDGGPQVEMRFEPPLANVFFDQGNKAAIRAFFFDGKIPPGSLAYRVTWRTRGVVAQPTLSERLGGSPASWPTDPLSQGGAVPDLGALTQDRVAAGKHGFVRAVDGELKFADGTPARFWGTNVAAYALFTTPREEVQRQAKRLAALGYNLVRLHHMDSEWVSVNVFGRRSGARDTRTLDPAAMEQLDWWIKCLEDEGLYVWLDLHVERNLRAGDGITGFDEIRKGRDTAELKGFNYVNPSIQQAMAQFNADYLSHKNSYTGLRYVDDPGVASVLLTNENDMTQHFGNSMLPDKKVPLHDGLYMAEAKKFADSTGLPEAKVWRSWEPGPSKLFLNDLEHRFDAGEIAGLRHDGARMPVATTSLWGNNPLWSLPALTTGDLVDAHAYAGFGALENDPLFTPNLVDWLASAHVVGYPMSVTEWNVASFTTQDRQDLPLYIAATAAHQGWDALMQFAYTQQPTNSNAIANWNAYNDPGLVAMMPAAALLYRERHVHEATSVYVLAPDAAAIFDKGVSAGTSVALRTAVERGKLLVRLPESKALPWMTPRRPPPGAVTITDPDKPLLAPDATEAVSDNGELARNWADGIFTVDTPRTRAAMGWIGGRTIHLHGVEMAFANHNLAVAVQSLDDVDIGKSTNMLISLGERSQPAQAGRPAFVTEPPNGALKIAGPVGLRLFDSAGNPSKELAATYRDGWYTISFTGHQPTHWLYLRAGNWPQASH